MQKKMLVRLIKSSLNKLREIIYRNSGRHRIVVDRNISKNDTILLISEANVPRIERMIFFLKKHRTEQLILIGSKKKFNAAFFNRCPEVHVILLDFPWQIKQVITQFNKIKLIHTFESRSIYPYYAIKYKPSHIPVIFDFQDLYTNYTGDKKLPGWMRENLYYERFCLNKADAFISYSLELIPARKSLKIHKKKTLYFPFYVDDFEIQQPKQNSSSTINLVYAGGIADLNRNISFNMSLTEIHIRNSNVFLHVYPSPFTDIATIESYKTFAETHPNLILHNSVSNQEMAKILNQYDYGIVPFFKTLEYQSEAKYKYSSALKIWNYIEAGLPVIIMKDVEYQAWLIKHMKIGLVLNEAELKILPEILNKTNHSEFAVNLQKIQIENKLSDKIQKINTFYNQLTKL